jgi:hypothetical protein
MGSFVEKLEDIVWLYHNPPEHALVLCCDEKSQVQALDRTHPGLPLKKGRAATMTHDYKRHDTTTLFAALSTLNGSLLPTASSPRRVAGVPTPHRPGDAQEHGTASDLQQLRHTQAFPCSSLARQAPALSCALHPYLGAVAEHG